MIVVIQYCKKCGVTLVLDYEKKEGLCDYCIYVRDHKPSWDDLMKDLWGY